MDLNSINKNTNLMDRLKVYKFRLHHYLDFLIGICMLTVVFLFSMDQDNMARRILFIVGSALILNNLITKHKSGLTEVLCVSTHLRIDLFLGIALGITPFLYKPNLHMQLWCLIFALLVVLNALLSKIPKKQQHGHDLI